MKINLIDICLVFLILVGVATGIYQALVVPITSDIVNPGLYAREFWSGNQQFFVPVNDPYIIDYAISLITVPLSGYSARGLYVQSLLVYLVIILLAYLVVKNISGVSAGLLAGGLVANVPFQSLQYLVSPLYHGTTIMLILTALLTYQKLEGRLKTFVVFIILIIGSINDTLIIPMFTAPFLIYNLIRYQEKDALGMIIASLMGIVVFLFKRGEMWPDGMYMVSVGGIGNIIGLNPQLNMVLQYFTSLTVVSGLIIFIPLVIGVYLAWNNKDARPLIVLTGLAALFMLCGFIFMYTSGGDLGRWLYPLPVLAMIPISIATGKNKPFNNMLAVLLVCLLLYNNIWGMIGQDTNFNSKDYELIDYLHSVNVSHAYANYWASNLLTYLDPAGQLKIAPVQPVGGHIQFLYIQSSINWTNWGWPHKNSPVIDESPVIIAYTPGDPLYDWAQQINNVTPPAQTYVYNDYHTPGYDNITIWIYKYNTSIPAWPVESLNDFQSRGLKPV
jgi:hypothetical protein